MKNSIYSFFCVIAGFFVSALGFVAIGLLENYYVDQGIGEILISGLRAFLSFFLGVYVFSFSEWLLSKEEMKHVPLFVTASVALSVPLGALSAAFVMILLEKILPDGYIISSWLRWVYWVIVFAFAYAGIYFFSRLRKAVSWPLKKSLIMSLAGFLLIAAPLFLSIRGLNFPRASSIEARHKWAQKTFDHSRYKPYSKAGEFIRNSPLIISQAGSNILFAPAANGRNLIVNGIDGSIAYFTLEVKGDKGKGICGISVLIDYHSDKAEIGGGINNLPVIWKFEGRRVELKKD